jgi:hypothetical protein
MVHIHPPEGGDRQPGHGPRFDAAGGGSGWWRENVHIPWRHFEVLEKRDAGEAGEVYLAEGAGGRGDDGG